MQLFRCRLERADLREDVCEKLPVRGTPGGTGSSSTTPRGERRPTCWWARCRTRAGLGRGSPIPTTRPISWWASRRSSAAFAAPRSGEKNIDFLTRRWWRSARVASPAEAQASVDRFCVEIGDKRPRTGLSDRSGGDGCGGLHHQGRQPRLVVRAEDEHPHDGLRLEHRPHADAERCRQRGRVEGRRDLRR